MVTGSSKVWVGIDDKPKELLDSSQYTRRILSTTITDGTLSSVQLVPENIHPPASFSIESTISVTISDVMTSGNILISLSYSTFTSIYKIHFIHLYSPGTYTFKFTHILGPFGPENTANSGAGTFYVPEGSSGDQPSMPRMWYTPNGNREQAYVSGKYATFGMTFDNCTYVNSRTTIIAYT